VGYVDVFRNGVRLAAADFTATTGTTIVLTSAASAGDTITTVSFYVSSVLNAIPATNNSVQQTYLASGVAGTGPAFSAYMSGISQSFSNAVQTKIQCNTEDFDTANCYDSSTNYRFTPNVAGYYQFNGCFIGPGSATGIVAVSVYKNGALNKWGAYISNGTSSNQATVAVLIYANGTTDYFEFYGLQSSGSTYNTGSGAHTDIYFQAYLARAA
jgi:hypothetical protein